MGAKMRRLRLTKLLQLAALTLLLPLVAQAADQDAEPRDEIKATRIQRDLDGVTTVLLVPARPGKSAPPVGILTKTARTFVQDGASTEYATQVLGTTLDNGRLYAKILSTSSRVFYDNDKEPSPDQTSPYVVYPSKSLEDSWREKLALDDTPIKIIETISQSDDTVEESTARENLNELKENDIFNRRENNEVRFKPAKVRIDNLPTYTVKQDYVGKGLESALDDEPPKTYRPRVPKIFKPQPKVSPKKADIKPLATVTYHGFADFVTTVGDTVIVFSPSTAPAPVARPATKIKGDATLRPDDGIAVLKIRPTSVLPGQKKTETLSDFVPDFAQKQPKEPVDKSILDALQPSIAAQPEGNSGQYTSPLLLIPNEETGVQNPTGLIKVIDSTASSRGTTTHYMSSIYGTYIGTNYAQIVHTSSNVFFYPEDSTKGYGSSDTDEDHEEQNTTTPPETTDNILTTIKDTPTTESTTENELGNDIIPLNQGRSIKGSSPKNQLHGGKENKQQDSIDKVSFSTRLLPSTIYKTFTYFTTFFSPGGQTGVSIKSREVVNSEVTFLTELISPTSTESPKISPTKVPTNPTNKVEVSSNMDLVENTNFPEKQEIEEIQLIFKTIFTTFTYLTTFYDDSTTSVSSRKVTATNVITQTVDPFSSSINVDSLLKEPSILIVPTKTADVSYANAETKIFEPQNINNNNYFTTEETTENLLTTVSDQLTTVEDQPNTEATTESEKEKDDSAVLLEPSPTLMSDNTPFVSEQLKTYYTTYTYFTTIIVDDESEIETRTEVFSNVITETIQPTSVQSTQKSSAATLKPQPPPEILAYLEALKKQKAAEEARNLAKKVQEEQTQPTTEDVVEITTEDSALYTISDETTIIDALSTEKNLNEGEVRGSMKTDVIFTSSSGGSTVLDVADKKVGLPEDQELSETNHHDVEPAPTLLLQTSYTTYTYFTTMYNGDATDVVSRLKTVTNIVTETIKPTAVMQPELKTVQPLTYFTTFTYWTTFIKGDLTDTTSREETVSNVVTPGVSDTSSVQLDVIKTYRPFVLATPVHSSSTELRESKATSENEVTTSQNVILKEIPTIKINELSSTISPEPMTLYTTYTYFTTSYIGNSTILKSRLETVTSVSYPDDLNIKATPRAIGGAAPATQLLNTEEKPIVPSKVNDAPKTGLLSTIRLSEISDGTTTHYMTDIYGTYIDGLYAQVVETSTKVELPSPVYSSVATPILPTGVLSLNIGSIIDADEISTVYYTTKQIGTSINDLYAKVIESTSSTKIDEQRLATHTPVKGHRTGLVRLIKGQIEANHTTTYYTSKVIGTSIEGRYAQIIESTSSYLVKPTSTLDIAPSSTLPPNHATGIPAISPSPAVIQSSISEDHTEEILNNDSDHDDNENEDEGDDQKSKKKSRLTFSSRKRTSSAPPIRPFASRSRPTFNPKRKPQGATTITRSDITPTITATLAGKGSRFASSRGRATPALGSSSINASSSRRFSGRRTSAPNAAASTNYPAGSSRSRGAVRATPSSIYSGSRRGPTSIRGSSVRPATRGSSLSSLSSTRYRPGIRPSSTLAKVSPTVKQEDQEDNANEFTTATLVTEETPLIQEGEDETIPPTIQTTTEPNKRSNNPLLRFRRPPAFGSGVRSTTPRPVATTTPRRTNNLSRQSASSRPVSRTPRPTPSTFNARGRQSQSSLFPPRTLFGRKPDTTEAPAENKNENAEVEEEETLGDEPVEEITDNDYEGSEQKESAPSNQKTSNQKSVQIKPFTRIGRGRRVRRQTSQARPISSRFRRPTVQAALEERSDVDVSSSKEEVSKSPINNSRYGARGRSLASNNRPKYSANKEDTSSEEYVDTPAPQTRSRLKPTSNRSNLRIKPSHVTSSNRQFTLRDKETTASSKPSYKRPSTSSRPSNVRSRNNSRPRTGTNRYQEAGNSRRSSSRTSTRSGSRNSNRRIAPSRGRLNSHEDYRDDFDGTITVTHYVPTEVTIPIVNNGVTEKKNIITAQPSTEIIGPDRYSTIANTDGRDLVVLASEMTGTNFQGQVEITKFVIHETPTTKVSHMLTSSGGRRFSQPVVVPSTIYSVENVVSTIRPSLPDNSPLANILLSQLLLGQLGQQNPLAPGALAPPATPSTRYDTRATTYITTITKQQSTVIPLTFRGDFLHDGSDVSAVIEGHEAFGRRTQGYDDYNNGEEDDYVARKRVRVRVPVIRTRSSREHALTVVRRRPLVPYTRPSPLQPIDISPSPTSRRIVTRTRIRNFDSIDLGNNLGEEIPNDLYSKTNRHKVTVTRRRKIRPTATFSSSHRDKITRKKLVTVRPVPEPTSTLAIITDGFYTAPSDESDDEYYDSEDTTTQTPNLPTMPQFESYSTPLASIETKKSILNLDKSSSSIEPIIITDNFFLPGFYEESTTLENKNDFDEVMSTTPNEASDGTTLSTLEQENTTTQVPDKETVLENVEKEAKGTNNTENTEISDVTETILFIEKDESTTPIESIETTYAPITEADRVTENINEDLMNSTVSMKNEANIETTTNDEVEIETTTNSVEDDLRVIPIMPSSEVLPTISNSTVYDEQSATIDVSLESNREIDSSEIPTVIPLETKATLNTEFSEVQSKATPSLTSQESTSLPPLTPEDIEAGLSDDLYLSLSRPDFPQIAPSKVEVEKDSLSTPDLSLATPELETSVYYSETVVTSTRLRTYTYVVTKLNGLETEVTSSTTVRPRVTSLTLTVPVTVTVTPTLVPSSVALNTSLERTKNTEELEDEGRRFNLATRIMSNGVEVIVAGTTPAYRWENSNPQPTLTLSEAVVMLLPQDKPNEFVTKTCTTTFTYLNTITRDGMTIVSTDQQVIANTATEERHRKPASEAASVTLEASPTLQTEVFKTTYTYLTLNNDHPNEKNALGSSTRVIANTVTAPQDYLDMILEPSEIQKPETNTYVSTRALEKTYVEDGKTRIEMTNDVITQLIITESALPSRSASIASSLTPDDESISPTTDIAKTYYVTYTYYNTYLEKDSTVVKTNIATSSDIVYEKAPAKTAATKSVPVASATPEPIQIFATKTYLTTFTYFTTLLQAGSDGGTSTIISSRTHTVENVVTESIAPSLLDPGYMNALLTTSHHSDSLKNVVTGSTIIFFDDEESVSPTTTSSFEVSPSASVDKIDNFENTSALPVADSVGSETNDVTSRPVEPDNTYNEEEAVEESTDPPPSKKPSQVSNLLSLGSLGINSLSALGPVITAMAGLLQGKTSATRRNDTEAPTESPVTTTQRSPIYIPVAEFVDGDIETAESQNIALHLANNNHLPETRHKVTSSLADGIPISPGEVITANSDVIIGKPAKLGPRPPQSFLNDENIGMKPPPVPVPSISVNPVLEVVENEPIKKAVTIQKGIQQLEIFPAHQIYEEHIKVPAVLNQPVIPTRPQNLHQPFPNSPPKRISAKQDILENDPLLIPPSILSNMNAEIKNRNPERSRRPWSPKDPTSNSNGLHEEKNQVYYPQKEFIERDNIANVDRLKLKPHGPEPIVHQVPHVIDRSTGQPLLVNIQPSQVANVVIPQGGTQALIFGDTSEPHISGQYFDDPSPYPEPEVGPGFVGLNKVENLPQFSNTNSPADYMTPPSPPKALKPSLNSNVGNRPHIIPLSQGIDLKPNINMGSRLEKIPTRHHDNVNLSSGQSHVHTEILVHHGTDNGHGRPQSRPTIPPRNYQNQQFPPRRDHAKIHIPAEQIPPRRTEIPMPTENSYFDSANTNPALNNNWKNEKKPSRNPPTRWPRPTPRPRPPPRITGRPYGRPSLIERPVNPMRQPQFTHTQRLPTNTHYTNEFNSHVQHSPVSTPFLNLNQQLPAIEIQQQVNSQNKGTTYQENYGNLQDKMNQTVQDNGDYVNEDLLLATDIDYKNPSGDDNQGDKSIDSEVDASENVKVTSNSNKHSGEEDFVIETERDKYETTIKFDHNSYFHNASVPSDNYPAISRPSYNISIKNKVNSHSNDDGDIIIGSEKKQDHYLSESSFVEMEHSKNQHNGYMAGIENTEENPTDAHEIIDLKPPSIIPVFEPNGHSRPFSKPHFAESNVQNKPEIITESPKQVQNIFQGHMRPGLGQVLHVSAGKNEAENQLDSHRNESYLHSYRGRPRPEYTRVHPNHPQIITKPKLQVPGPVVVSSGKLHKQNNYRRPSVQFSLPIDSIGEENESKTQTETPPRVGTDAVNKKPKEESLDTAFQTNFASSDSKDNANDKNEDKISSYGDLKKITVSKTKILSEDMEPPPVMSVNIKKGVVKNQAMDEGLQPPPSPTDVLGMSPPPVDITTKGPAENKVGSEVSGLKPPPLYIPLKESTAAPPLPSVSMIPPTPRPSIARPYLADILSQDMVPPPLDPQTTQPLEIATVRPGVAVSGSIQIATAVATSHIPVIQDLESKIPIVHGTVDLPVVIDVPAFLKPVDSKKTDRVSVYTVRPFETRQRNTIRPTISPTSTSTLLRPSQVNNEQQHSANHRVSSPTRPTSTPILRKPSKAPEFSVLLEPSNDIHLSSSKIEPTESLTVDSINKRTRHRSSPIEVMTKAPQFEHIPISKTLSKSEAPISEINKSNLKIKESASKMMEIIGTVVHEFIQNSTNERVETVPQEVTRFETLTVTRTETSVVGYPPTTSTLLITHTLTSTRVETVTETLLRPTSVISTITSTVLQSVTRVPAYEHENDNESIFVVMSDQKPPAADAEEVEAEYGEEDISRDEQDISGNEIHRVLSGGILGAASVPIRPPKVQCVPECKASKSEICAEASGEMRCVCRPGFARMFPDRPCKPTYTFTVGVGLDRHGRDRFVYDSAMNDSGSVVFRRYAHPIREALDRTLMQSDLRDMYRGLNIAKFLPDPLRVLFNVQLSSNTDEARLKEVIRKYLLMSNYSLGGTDVYAAKDLGTVEAVDFDECTTRDGGPHHDCSANAACFNLRGSYQCSCKEGFADLSENPAYPGRICSQAPLGCASCNNKGHCMLNSHGQEVCECFPWHSGQKCQVNLKVLLIGLVTTGAILLGLLAVCMGMACLRNPSRRRASGDRRAMISGAGGGDTSSEGSVAELAIPHHVPHILPPPPQMMAPAPPMKKAVRKISGKGRRAPRKPAPVVAPVAMSANCSANEQRDRSLTVMIPRAKIHRPLPQSATPQNYKPMSSFAVDEHKLIDYLDGGVHPGNRKASLVSNSDYKESEHCRISKQHSSFAPSGALVSAGFQVSATVTRTMDADSTLARSCGETTVEQSTKILRGGGSDFPQDLDSTLVRSCAETTIQASTKQLMRLDLAEAGSTLARSCGETTIQPPTKMAERNKDCNRDSASEGHTMAERDLGSTLRLPAQHAPLYNPDRTSSDRESNFDSL